MREEFEARVREIATEEIGRHLGILEQKIEEAIQQALGRLFGPAKPTPKTAINPAPAAQRRRPGRPRKIPEEPRTVPVSGAKVVEPE